MNISNNNVDNGKNTAREFAAYFLALGNPQEAAMKLGVPPERALAEGFRLMQSGEVKRELRRQKKCETARAEALAGLRRLAFGRVNDAIELLNDGADCISADELDLFNVSEIKRPKGGGVEIRFFDRLEALEKLAELESREASASSADRFFSALSGSAKESSG